PSSAEYVYSRQLGSLNCSMCRAAPPWGQTPGREAFSGPLGATVERTRQQLVNKVLRRRDRIRAVCCDCSQPLVYLLRQGGWADQFGVFGEERKRRELAAIWQFGRSGLKPTRYGGRWPYKN